MGRLLRQWAPHQRVLALTATAAPAVRQAICDTLHIPPQNMLLDCRLPPHLRLAVSRLPTGAPHGPCFACSHQGRWSR